MWNAILTVLLGLQPHQYDAEEPPAERAERMATIAKAIDYASSRVTCSGPWSEVECDRRYPGSQVELASLLLAIGHMESGFAGPIQDGRCRDHECDAYRRSDGTVAHRARSYWQVHRNSRLEEVWDEMVGIEQWPTNNSAWAAAIVLAGHRYRCKTVLGALSGYAGVPSCDWDSAQERATFAKRLAVKLRQAQRAPAPALAPL
jgi:hypothetical protein